jgi:hypothetical protein
VKIRLVFSKRLRWNCQQLSVKPMKSFRSVSCAAIAIVVTVISSKAAVSYSIVGSSYTQNFDSLPNSPTDTSLGNSPAGWTDDNASPGAGNFSIVGWYLYHPTVATEGGFNSHQRVRIGAGGATTGAFMSYGASGNTERALGSLNSNTLTPAGSDDYIGLRLSNNTGQTLYSFTVTFDGEQWRDGGAAIPNAQSLVFMWSTTATAINDPNTSFITAPALNFTSPVFVNAGSGAAVDGNSAGKVSGITATVEGINWETGTDLWLRWNDLNNSGNDHGLAIDDFSFVAQVPEPATYALIGIGIASVLIFRRRK